MGQHDKIEERDLGTSNSNSLVAIEHVGYALSDSSYLFLSGSSLLGSHLEKLHENRTLNLFGNPGKLSKLNARDGAARKALNALRKGDLATTYLSSENLMLLIPNFYQSAAQMIPSVFHVAVSKKCSSTSGIYSSEDHSDLMTVRETGMALLASSTSEECHDMAIVAHLASLKSKVPILHFYDGLSIEASSKKEALLPYLKLANFIHSNSTFDEDVEMFRNRALDENDAEKHNDLYTEPCQEAKDSYIGSGEVIQGVMNLLNSTLGRDYRLFDFFGDADAEYVVVLIGSSSLAVKRAVTTMRANWNAKVGVVNVRVYRPWCSDKFIECLPNTVRSVAVLDRCVDVKSSGEPLFLDVLSSMHSKNWQAKSQISPKVFGGSYGVGMSTFDEVSARNVFEELASGNLEHGFKALSIGSRPSKSAIDTSFKPNVIMHEKPYLKILSQLFGNRALVANLLGSSDIHGTSKVSHNSDLKSTIDKLRLTSNSQTSSFTANSEYGFGVHLALAQQRQNLKQAVQNMVYDSSEPTALNECLSKWLSMSEGYDTALVNKIEVLLENEASNNDPLISKVYELRHFFPKFSHWIIGSEEWSDDLGVSGIHQVLASGEDVNLFVLDTDPYSAVKEALLTRQHQRRKKDIGLYGMTYGNAYVASVALYDSYSHVLRAVAEADAFPGPSIILAYSPNVVDAEGPSSVLAEQETRDAVDSGYWPLYRWNPLLEKKGIKPFALDSIRIKSQLRKFLERENVLSIMSKDAPKFDSSLTASTNSSLDEMLLSSFDKLSGALGYGDSGPKPPLLILIGSDNGHAEGIAGKLEEDAKLKGMQVQVMDMDDFPVSDLETLDGTPVVFVCSTAGQGEFPANSKEFWTTLQGLSDNDINVSGVKCAVFGLGDSHYWPREDEKHYYCKAPKDLDKKLSDLGASKLVEIGLGDDQDEDGPETGFEKWKILLWESLGVSSPGDSTVATKKVTNEDIKNGSNFLRGTLEEGLADRSTAALSESDTQLTKFHGIYQQDDRDLRAQRRLEKKEKAFSFMIRVRVPGGISTASQYLAIDELSDKYANGNIKLTTRQAYQLQGILKWDLKGTVKGINRALMDSLAACGDVNRNVMANPNPDISEVHGEVFEIAKDISAHLTPQTSAYHEIWLDKKCVGGGEHESRDFEPIYGEGYLPRKFKIAMAIPPSNDVDVFAHCLGFIAIVENKKLVGFNVSVGGGMGMTHNNKATFPRLADIMGFCLPHQAKEVAEMVMIVQRDHGDRVNRKHARFKYTVEDHGLPWIKVQVEKRLGWELSPPKPFKITYNGDRFGWTKTSSGRHLYTLFVEGGRIKDLPNYPLRSALREIATGLSSMGVENEGDFRLTANQNLIIGNLTNDQKSYVESMLKKHKLNNDGISAMRLNSIACAALPFCGLALAESERYLPSLISKLDDVLESCNLLNEPIVIRMTGCPNGCGRPYLGEIGFVGRAPGIYNLYLGAGFAGERLNKLYKEALDEDGLMQALEPVLRHYSTDREKDEKFGDFVIRQKYVTACDAAPLVKVRAAGDTFHA